MYQPTEKKTTFSSPDSLALEEVSSSEPCSDRENSCGSESEDVSPLPIVAFEQVCVMLWVETTYFSNAFNKGG